MFRMFCVFLPVDGRADRSCDSCFNSWSCCVPSLQKIQTVKSVFSTLYTLFCFTVHLFLKCFRFRCFSETQFIHTYILRVRFTLVISFWKISSIHHFLVLVQIVDTVCAFQNRNQVSAWMLLFSGWFNHTDFHQFIARLMGTDGLTEDVWCFFQRRRPASHTIASGRGTRWCSTAERSWERSVPS